MRRSQALPRFSALVLALAMLLAGALALAGGIAHADPDQAAFTEATVLAEGMQGMRKPLEP